MKVIDQLVLACTLLGVATDAAVPVLNPRGTGITITQVPRTVENPHHNIMKHVLNKQKRRFLKTGADAGPGSKYKVAKKAANKVRSKKGNRKDQAPMGSSSIVANSINGDIEYICEVQVGGQKMRLNFDTGSSDLWVYSTMQPKNQQKDHLVYDPKKSSDSQPLQGGTWNISYGDGSSAGGDVHRDKVTLGGVSFDKQAFGLAKNVSDSFYTDNTNDGLLGLGFSKGTVDGSGNTISINGKPDPQNTFFTNIRKQLPLPIFTADLKHQAPGSYDFGFINKTKFTGDIVYFPANSSQAYWQVTSQSYGVAGKTQTTKTIQTIIDTGTTLMMMPQDVLDKYYKEVKGAKNDQSQGGYVYSCGTKLPDFNIGFDQNGQKFTAVIPGKYMDFGPVSTGSSTCFGAMQLMSASDSLDAIYGDIFLKAVFTVFEAVNDQAPRLGFAMKPEAQASLTNPSSSGSGTPTSSGSAPSSTTCSVDINNAAGAMAWFRKMFNNVKAAITGKKDGICVGVGTDGGSDGSSSSSDGSDGSDGTDSSDGSDGSDGSDSNSGADGTDGSDNDGDNGDGSDGDDNDNDDSASKKKSAAKKKAAAMKKKKAALKKAIKAAQKKLDERDLLYEYYY